MVIQHGGDDVSCNRSIATAVTVVSGIQTIGRLNTICHFFLSKELSHNMSRHLFCKKIVTQRRHKMLIRRDNDKRHMNKDCKD